MSTKQDLEECRAELEEARKMQAITDEMRQSPRNSSLAAGDGCEGETSVSAAVDVVTAINTTPIIFLEY